MVFSSTTFLFYFLPIVLIGNFIIDKKYINYFLLIMSIIFFSWGQINYLYIIIVNIFINYTFSLLIENLDNNKKVKKILLIVAGTLNLLILVYFKYMDFLIEVSNTLFSTKFDALKIILPIGISFFTFQGLSYTIDVYKKDTKAEKNIINLALYIILFPQLIAGPIVRYVDIKNELINRKTTLDDYVYGIKRFIIGLSKKVIIANVLGKAVDSIYIDSTNSYTQVLMFICMICYMYQIYYDFSGYSDMAIGLGKILGFTYKENFNYPYESNTITEFWRRWHISLSQFFRDYVYIPLGGNRKGEVRTYINLVIVFLLTGFWHGASINFIIWGLWYGIFLIIEKLMMKYVHINIDKNKYLQYVLLFIKRIYVYVVVYIGWIWFRCYDFDSAILYFQKLFGIIKVDKIIYNTYWYMDNFTIFILILAILFSCSYYKKLLHIIKQKIDNNVYELFIRIAYVLLFIICIVMVYQNSYNPFIYFQF